LLAGIFEQDIDLIACKEGRTAGKLFCLWGNVDLCLFAGDISGGGYEFLRYGVNFICGEALLPASGKNKRERDALNDKKATNSMY